MTAVMGRDIVRGLGGRWVGRKGVAKCPAHDDRTPSLSVSETRDGRALVHCFAGCTQRDVIDALRARGLWHGEARPDAAYIGRLTSPADGARDADERQRVAYARELWERADRIKGTLAETYLRARGISRLEWPEALGFLPRVMHKPSGRTGPVLLAAITDSAGQVEAVQRTWIADDGASKAPVDPAKMTIGRMGNGAVRLSRSVGATLGLAEGVETALSAAALYAIPVWATLSASRLSRVHVPKSVEALVIFADAGQAGMGQALEAAETYERAGLAVDVIPPAVHFGAGHGDFNDVVRHG